MSAPKLKIVESREPQELDFYLRQLRAGRWRVANHYDTQIGLDFYTVWLFTHPDGRWTRGIGVTDLEAVKVAYDSSKTNR